MIISLPSLEHTAALAEAMAKCLVAPYLPILLQGHLGAGKTTFVRAFVAALPGGAEAEVSSPSFNLLNIYPTLPPIGHFDLYRTSGNTLGDDLEEILVDPAYCCVIEWAEFLPSELRAEPRIEMNWAANGEIRTVHLRPCGEAAVALMNCVNNFISF